MEENKKKYIAHRGNIDGQDLENENKVSYIDLALNKGFDVEIDVWYKNKKFWLGHDQPNYFIDLSFLSDRKDNLWIHCKNCEALEQFSILDDDYNYFWHQNDCYTLTSKKYVWAYPNEKVCGYKAICVMPERNNIIDFTNWHGICSDIVGMIRD